MKKLLAFLVLALGLVACGQKETPAPVAEQPAAEQAAEAVDGAKEAAATEAPAAEAVKEPAADAAKEPVAEPADGAKKEEAKN